MVIYVVFGALLVVLALALHALVHDGAPELAQVATAFGLIWAGLLTIIQPFFLVAVTIFGIGGIAWFIWLGVALLRGTPVREARAVVGKTGLTG